MQFPYAELPILFNKEPCTTGEDMKCPKDITSTIIDTSPLESNLKFSLF